MRKIILTFLVLFCALPAAAQGNWQQEGERLTFSVGMGFITIGKAEILFEPQKEGYRITSRAWTNTGVSSLFTLRDRIVVEGKHSPEDFLTDSYHLQLNENEYQADKLVTYAQKSNSVQYENKHGKEKPVTFSIVPNTRDLLSALYYLRKHQTHAKPGDSSILPVFDLERQYQTEVKIEAREQLKTIFGRIDVLKVRFYMKEVGSDKVKDDWVIWVTDDENYIPVKIKVYLPVGSFGAHLSAIGSATSGSQEPEGFPAQGKITIPERSYQYANPLED